MKSLQKGFTLIELLVVLAIIGVLTSFLLANFIGAKARARDAQRKSDLRELQSAFELYRTDTGNYPASPLGACGSSITNGGTTYIKKIPCDPLTGTKYSYTQTGAGYTITTCLENVNDSQKDSSNKNPPCAGGTRNWSYTLTNP